MRPTELHPSELVTIYMDDEHHPLPTPLQHDPTTGPTNEAKLSSDLARG